MTRSYPCLFSKEEHVDIKNIAGRELLERGENMGTIEEMLIRRGREEGIILGTQQGTKQGKIEAAQEMLLEALGERFGAVNQSLIEKIKTVQSVETIKMLFRQCFRADSLEGFEEQVRRAIE